MTAVRVAAALGLATAALGLAVPAAAAATGAPVTRQGTQGQSLTVSRADGLDPNGEQVTVTGEGFDEEKGVYVAFCVVPPVGQPPSPCGGGVDTSGASGASHWVSSDPPEYGRSLAKPYSPGGRFSVTLTVSGTIGEDVDCTVAECAVVTRADHTRSSDRSQDVLVPVSFAPGGASASTAPAAATAAHEQPDGDGPGLALAAGGGAAAAAAVGAVLVLSRRRRRGTADA
ncbi:hypothetical protein [Motilibacter aurantiacus]|uniref:hypothetical protein n=1 Tax=Motilibacter aurantiacus TaxID=2714955 RepID=UPI0014088143|nr:hypothetical protein [Motilibacter aurantiacus]NHC45149.1 hypothetical protein [Motilibacter aurantiacus]